MTRPFEHWTVLPHGKLQRLDDDILSVTGRVQMPLGHIPRTMTIVRLSDARLIIYSAIALAEGEMKEIERFGQPAFLVVPSSRHRLDLKGWKERYPALQVVTTEAAREAVEEVVPVDTTTVDFDDPNVHLTTVAGTDDEMALTVETRTGATLIISDLIGHMPDESGLKGWLFRKLGFTGPDPMIPSYTRRNIVKDASALRKQLLAWANIRGLKRIIVAHGAPIDREPARALHHVAATLG